MQEEDNTEGFSWKNFFISFVLAFIVFAIFFTASKLYPLHQTDNTSILQPENKIVEGQQSVASTTLTITILPANKSGEEQTK